jgi:hypothetical protein
VSNKHPNVGERSDREDSYFGYSTSGVRIVTRREGSFDPLPVLEGGDILFYTIVDGLRATEEIKEMKATRVKFLEGGEGLEDLGDYFMKNCTSLREVCFGNFRDLKSIGEHMFTRCTSLVQVSFEGLNSLESIGNGMFYWCTSLVQVSFKGLDRLKSIGYHMFYMCTSLVQVSFKGLDSLERIGDVHFNSGDYLKHMLEVKVFKQLHKVITW